MTDWSYPFFKGGFRVFLISAALLQFVFYGVLKEVAGFEEIFMLRALSALMLVGLTWLDFEKLSLPQKIFVELTAWVSFPLLFSILFLMNPQESYWFASMVFCGFGYGLLAFPPLSFLGYGLTALLVCGVYLPIEAPELGFATVFAYVAGLISLLVGISVQLMMKFAFQSILEARIESARMAVMERTMNKLQRREKVIRQFIRPSILFEIEQGKDPTKYLPEKKYVYILFIDMRQYSTFSENHSLEESYKILNQYFEEINKAIFRFHGEVDKFIGDAVMATFAEPDHCYEACIEARRRLSNINRIRLRRGQIPIKYGTGISCGQVLSANFGSRRKMERTVIGDVVNVAARLESLTKEYETDIFASEEFISKLDKYEAFRVVDYVTVKGRQEKIFVYELFSHNKDSVLHFKLQTKETLKEIIECKLIGEYKKALRLIDGLIAMCPPHSFKESKIMDTTLLAVREQLILEAQFSPIELKRLNKERSDEQKIA